MVFRKCAAGIAAILCVCGGPALADKPAPFPEFESRRVKPPAPGTKKRITVQITEPIPVPKKAAQPDPEPESGQDPSVAEKPTVTAMGRYDWFWDQVSPDLSDSTPGRLFDALQALNARGDVATPRLQALQNIARANGAPILKSTVGTSVSPALVLAMIAVESSGRVDAVSSAGAQGLMQLMPATAERFGVSDRLIPDQNISGGVKYLDWLMREFDGDPILVLAGYNAGEGAVRNHKGVPPYAETRDYVPKVLAAFQVARGLCSTPPELITDGCVFVAMN